MLHFGVSLKKENDLQIKMVQLGIKEEDLEEKFIYSSGKGGQNVNKNSTCVYIRHRPTGISVKCQQERYQGLNRYIARAILCSKIETIVLKRKSEQQKRIAKIRKQKRKRSKRAKEKILHDKKMHSKKKAERTYTQNL